MTAPGTGTAGTNASLATALAGRYAVGRELGRGGMATVYLADDEKHQRQVAIKVLRPELAATLGPERFLREIGIAARLAHPHIVPLIDSGEAGGVLYYVSPYVPGGSLRERLGQGPLPVGDAIRIAQEVGAGLDFAHRQGFVHRDVKPENILFADGLALLADFGIARAADACGTSASTSAGIAIGTPQYMSPEQAAGDPDLGPRSDLYGLACVVYEMLAGAPPFPGTNARAVMSQQVMEAPRPLRALRPDVPPAVDDAVARALAKNPDERPASVAEFTASLAAEAAPRARRFVSTQRHIAVLPFVNASPDPENEYLSDGLTDELIDALSRVEGLEVSSRTSVFALKGKPQDIRAIGALLGVSVVLEGTVRKAGDRLRITAQLTSADDGRLLWSQRYDRTLSDVFAIQDEIAQTIVTTLRATLLANLATPRLKRYTDNVEAYRLYLKGRYAWNKRTQEGVTEAIAYFEQARAADPKYALAYTGLSDSYALQLDYRSVPVAEGFAHAKAFARQALELDDSLAEAHASLAWVLFIYDWDWPGAGRAFRRAIDLDPRYASARQWYAFLLASQGRLDDAIVESHAALELDPASVSIRRSVGWVYVYARRYEQALHHLARAVEMNPDADETQRVLSVTLALQGDYAAAERTVREAMALGSAGTYTAATLGYILGQSGRRDEAEEILRVLLARAARHYVSPVAFATIYLGLGDTTAALDCAERAYEERRGWLVYLKVNPLLDPLRGEPRFKALVEKMRL
jgi:serine/threonine-protein kinase